MTQPFVYLLLGLLLASSLAFSPRPAEARTDTFPARDTLTVVADREIAVEANQLLEAVRWEPEAFTVTAVAEDEDYDALVSFPSPTSPEDRRLATVPLLWYAARDDTGEAREAPAVLIVHTLHPQMLIGKAIARGLAQRGFHAFLIQLPGYGLRALPFQEPAVAALEHGPQALADVRRARDAIAALPNVAPGPIAIQGTSLGGFVAAAAAGASDSAFEPVVLALSGVDAYEVLEHGQHDAARLRERLERRGYTGEELRRLLAPLEPAHVAHRLDPQRTWLFTARHDQVVPPASSEALIESVGLPEDHHVQLEADHYSAALFLPAVVEQVARIIQESRESHEAPAHE